MSNIKELSIDGVSAQITTLNIDGVEYSLGSDTSDATATESDILLGKTAYVGGEKVTGTIPSKSSQIYIPTTSNQTIALGQYLSGIQTIKGDTNLLAANIKSGISIFGISGTQKLQVQSFVGEGSKILNIKKGLNFIFAVRFSKSQYICELLITNSSGTFDVGVPTKIYDQSGVRFYCSVYQYTALQDETMSISSSFPSDGAFHYTAVDIVGPNA